MTSYGLNDSWKGKVLAASPSLMDPNFQQSLVFLVEHDEQGAFGLVMNRPTGSDLHSMAVSGQIPAGLGDIPVLQGGPVQQGKIILAVFDMDASGHHVVCRLGLPLDDVASELDNEQSVVLAFSGYAGWGEGQLEDEIKDGAWKLCPPDRSILLQHVVGGLWSFFISGDRRWRPLIPYFPQDPSRN